MKNWANTWGRMHTKMEHPWTWRRDKTATTFVQLGFDFIHGRVSSVTLDSMYSNTFKASYVRVWIVSEDTIPYGRSLPPPFPDFGSTVLSYVPPGFDEF